MDMKKLVVGQKVRMQSGSLFKEATVTEITDKCIEAKPVHFGEKERPWLIRFREDGKQFLKMAKDDVIGDRGVYEWYEAEGFTGWWRDDPSLLCGNGENPWELVDDESAMGMGSECDGKTFQ
jgi:hypothetical protein